MCIFHQTLPSMGNVHIYVLYKEDVGKGGGNRFNLDDPFFMDTAILE